VPIERLGREDGPPVSDDPNYVLIGALVLAVLIATALYLAPGPLPPVGP
jgi:hypothetical protein